MVIGGGPAGTTIATLLKEQGWRITLFEKDYHPRFHIGESLLPMTLPLLDRLGVLDDVRRIGVQKYAADFTPGHSDQPYQPFYFSNGLDRSHPYAFQVRRSEFDEILFRNCASKGVDAHEGIRVRDVRFRPGETHLVTTVDNSGEEQTWETRFVIDASGRDTMLSRKLGLKKQNAEHQSAAIFGHYANVTRRPGHDAGNISIYWFEHGWFWMIPLRDDVMSVGAVCWPEYLKTRKTDPEDFLWQTIKLCPAVWERMRDARLVDKARATGNYSYISSRMYGDGYLLVGDAFAFIDPVFSTGVMLAMNGGMFGATAVDAYLRDPAGASKALEEYQTRMQKGIKTVSWFIYRFTSPAMQNLFMAPRNIFRMQQAIISVLAGDIFRKTPIATPVFLFKVVFYLTFLLNFSRAWASYKRRKMNVAEKFTGGTLPEDQRAGG
ncbi:MAG: NAD(P)/FAD-dependent oxidoreductase [Rhodospirillales bacterium]|nr:NAD(P)/FAD-dependent oxidoreductase [Rhodospirillales bacterium]